MADDLPVVLLAEGPFQPLGGRMHLLGAEFFRDFRVEGDEIHGTVIVNDDLMNILHPVDAPRRLPYLPDHLPGRCPAQNGDDRLLPMIEA